ncbi:MAG: hypothetical protein M9938_05725 [Solirubrobacterales bacterium]|nr:hypothetical protein [Solirubrobacterales bacterium]
MSANARAQAVGRRPPRRRPAPRRNAGRPGAGRIRWDRAGRIAFVAVLSLLALAAIKPAVNLVQNYRLVSQTRVRLHAAQAETDRLERKVKHLRGDSVLRLEARRQGMIEPNERAWVVNGAGR